MDLTLDQLLALLNKFYGLLQDPRSLTIVTFYIIGHLLKSIKSIQNDYIPLILGVGGAWAGFFLFHGLTGAFQGLIFAAGPVYFNELLKPFLPKLQQFAAILSPNKDPQPPATPPVPPETK